MPAQSTIIQELGAAARGSVALVLGDRRAAGYFDFSPRGVAGSFIAFLAATLFNALLPLLLGAEPEPGGITKSLVLVAILFAFQVGFSALVLRQLGRLDGLMPYLVADNWATFFITALAALLTVVNIAGDFALVLVAILVIVVEINIARLIVTLSPLQIAMFIVAQLVGALVGWLLVHQLFPGLLPELPSLQ